MTKGDDATTTPPEHSTARGRGAEPFGRIVALVVGVLFVAAGLWAFLAPAAFFESAATFEPYNVHFIRDIGAFQIGLGSVLLLATVVRDALLAALAGVGVGAVFHLLAHIIDWDLGGDPAVDVTLFGVIAVVLVAAAVYRALSLRR